MEHNQNMISNDLQIDATTQNHLNETTKWAKFLAIVGFLFSGLLAVASPFVPQFVQASNPQYSNAMQASGVMLTIIYLIMAALGFMTSLFVYRFALKTKRAMDQFDQDGLNKGMQNLKYLFRSYGIITVVYLGFIVLAIIVSVIAALFASN